MSVIPGPKLKEAETVVRLTSWTIGGTSATFNIEERSAVGSAGSNILTSDKAANTTEDNVTSSFNDSSLAADNHLVVDISAVSGTVSYLCITLLTQKT